MEHNGGGIERVKVVGQVNPEGGAGSDNGLTPETLALPGSFRY